MRRRSLLRGAALFTAGGGVGAVATAEMRNLADRTLPIRGGAAGSTTADGSTHPGHGQVRVIWAAETDRKLVALTFDDGPRPDWTTMVLDTLERYQVPATFFLVGRRVREYPAVLHGRMGRHEAANHTWEHRDLAQRGPRQAYDDLSRSHDAIVEVTGQTPTLLRPPYGHLAGSTALAASRMGYQIVLWTTQMTEGRFPGDPAGHAREMVARVKPGCILLAHDVGEPIRLVALRGLPEMIEGIRAKGYEFRTVGGLLAETAAG